MPSGPTFAITGEASEAVSAAETVVQLRGATTVRAQILGYKISFDGTTAAATPIRVRVLRQTTDGTATAATEVNVSNPDGAAPACAGFHSFTAEPTAGGVLDDFFVHPQGLPYEEVYPEDLRPVLGMAATSRIGIEVTPGAAVNCAVTLWWMEA